MIKFIFKILWLFLVGNRFHHFNWIIRVCSPEKLELIIINFDSCPFWKKNDRFSIELKALFKALNPCFSSKTFHGETGKMWIDIIREKIQSCIFFRPNDGHIIGCLDIRCSNVCTSRPANVWNSVIQNSDKVMRTRSIFEKSNIRKMLHIPLPDAIDEIILLEFMQQSKSVPTTYHDRFCFGNCNFHRFALMNTSDLIRASSVLHCTL